MSANKCHHEEKLKGKVRVGKFVACWNRGRVLGLFQFMEIELMEIEPFLLKVTADSVGRSLDL